MKNLVFTLILFSLFTVSYGQFNNGWIYDIRSQPYVITEAGQELYIELQLNNDLDMEKIEMNNCDNYSKLTMYGQSLSTIVFKDDGQGNDNYSGDLIYTSESLRLSESAPKNGLFTIESCSLDFYKNSGEIIPYSDISIWEESMDFNIRASRNTSGMSPFVREAGDRMRYSEYVVNVKGKSSFGEDQDVLKEFYKYFPDNRQFVFLVYLYMQEVQRQPQHTMVQAREIGVEYDRDSDFDNTVDYGSSGELTSVIVLASKSETNPYAWTHEVKHRWIAYLDPKLMLTDGPSHFSGDFWIEKNITQVDDTTYLAVDDPEIEYDGAWGCFDDLEMYLAGFGSYDSIPFPLQVLKNAEWTDFGSDKYISHDGIHNVSSSDFIGAMGYRSPSYEQAKKKFRGLLLINSEEFLSDDEFYYFDQYAKAWQDSSIVDEWDCENFYSITHGEATMSMKLSEPLVATKELASKALHKVFPNPFVNELNIIGNMENYQIQILDVEGRLRYTYDAINVINTIGLDLQSGVYVLRLFNVRTNEIWIEKIIKF